MPLNNRNISNNVSEDYKRLTNQNNDDDWEEVDYVTYQSDREDSKESQRVPQISNIHPNIVGTAINASDKGRSADMPIDQNDSCNGGSNEAETILNQRDGMDRMQSDPTVGATNANCRSDEQPTDSSSKMVSNDQPIALPLNQQRWQRTVQLDLNDLLMDF